MPRTPSAFDRSVEPPFDEAHFELFNIDDDRGETTNLTTTHPDIHRSMLELWHSERARLGIVLENLGDAAYRYHGSSVNGPGRSAIVWVELTP